MSPNEARLIELAQRGDPSAFEALVQRHAHFVYNLAFRLVHDTHEAENLSQDAFVRAWQALPAFRGEARFTTWLYQIVTRLCYNRLPGLRRDLAALDSSEEGLEMPGDAPSPEAGMISAELRQELHHAIAALPEGYRLLLTLRHLQELSYEEIAQATGLPLGTVKTGIHRARQSLRKSLKEYETSYA